MYTDFADVYDSLMAEVDYKGWARFYAGLLEAYGIRGGKLCECACGTGSLTIPLAALGFRMTGIDLSQEMLFQASNKARKAGMAIPFVRQDMRELRLHRPMDAILATCDGLNYLEEDEDVLAFFKAAYAALRPGGVIAFDVSTPYKLRTSLGNQLIGFDNEDVTYMWQNRWSDRTQTVDMHLCIFVREKDGSYRRIDEIQRQKAHGMQTLITLLQQAGFVQPHAYGDGRYEAPRDTEQRWHFAALKPAEL